MENDKARGIRPFYMTVPNNRKERPRGVLTIDISALVAFDRYRGDCRSGNSTMPGRGRAKGDSDGFRDPQAVGKRMFCSIADTFRPFSLVCNRKCGNT